MQKKKKTAAKKKVTDSAKNLLREKENATTKAKPKIHVVSVSSTSIYSIEKLCTR